MRLLIWSCESYKDQTSLDEEQLVCRASCTHRTVRFRPRWSLPLIQSTTCCGVHLLTASISSQIWFFFIPKCAEIQILTVNKPQTAHVKARGTSVTDVERTLGRSAAQWTRDWARGESLQRCERRVGPVSGYQRAGHAPSPLTSNHHEMLPSICCLNGRIFACLEAINAAKCFLKFYAWFPPEIRSFTCWALLSCGCWLIF